MKPIINRFYLPLIFSTLFFNCAETQNEKVDQLFLLIIIERPVQQFQ